MIKCTVMWYESKKFNIANYLIKIQLIVSMAIALMVLIVFKNAVDTASVVFGSLLVVLPTTIYRGIAFRKGLVVSPKTALIQHKKAMVAKFMLNCLLFIILIFVFKHCNFLFLFISYIITQGIAWAVLLKK